MRLLSAILIAAITTNTASAALHTPIRARSEKDCSSTRFSSCPLPASCNCLRWRLLETPTTT